MRKKKKKTKNLSSFGIKAGPKRERTTAGKTQDCAKGKQFLRKENINCRTFNILNIKY